jgi:hypothetical protein
MNSNDMERQKIREEELDDMGVLILSDECDAIEQVITFFKYCIPISILLIAGFITLGVLMSK